MDSPATSDSEQFHIRGVYMCICLCVSHTYVQAESLGDTKVFFFKEYVYKLVEFKPSCSLLLI